MLLIAADVLFKFMVRATGIFNAAAAAAIADLFMQMFNY